ncbi:MAG TPA: hypothetical protein VFU49_25405 [Ktedonobacteraceae bacterium]|nr:hypothetical protein [Ktedonobacteraceae bacterium]
MNKLSQMIHHPAGRIGLTMGLTLGFAAAVMGQTTKVLALAGLCRFLARHVDHPS